MHGRLVFQNSHETEGKEKYEVSISNAQFLSSTSGTDVTLQHERFVNDMNDAISALDVGPEHMDPVAVPFNIIICKINKLYWYWFQIPTSQQNRDNYVNELLKAYSYLIP